MTFRIPIPTDAAEDIGPELETAIRGALSRANVEPLKRSVAAFIAGADYARGVRRRDFRFVAAVNPLDGTARYIIAAADAACSVIAFTTEPEHGIAWLLGYHAFRDGSWRGPAVAIEETHND